VEIWSPTLWQSRSQWLRGLRRRSAAARLLRLWVWIPPGIWKFFCCECCVLSDRVLCDETITRPEESYWLRCVVECDLETSWMRRPLPTWAVAPRTNVWQKERCRVEYVEMKCQLDATEVCFADLIACSTCFEHHYAHHQELKSIIQWLLPVVFCAVVFKLLVWCGAEGYVSGLQDAAASCKPDT